MPSRKDLTMSMEDAPGSANAPLLQRIRQMWQFANLCQWIYIFGKAAKIDESLEIDEIEHECMRPTSTVLSDIGLALLKLVSSHRGLTSDIFDEQLRKQYLAKAPEINPLGDGEEESQTFGDLDVFTKIKVLQQLTQWVMVYPERLREKMDEQKDADQTSWRIEPYGWDAQDRTYYVLDDNRVYRLSDPPAAVVSKAKPKPKKTYGSSSRLSTRRRAVSDVAENPEPNGDNDQGNTHGSDCGGMKWECVAVTLEDVRLLINNMRKTRDGNEKVLRDQLEVHLLPILERQDESRKRKQERHEREMLNLAKMANAKRSSRIAHKVEQQKQDEKDREENERLLHEQEQERRAEQKRLKLEQERDFRMFSREKRLKERDFRRQLHREELNQLSEDKPEPDGISRVSERRVQLEIERNKQALKELEDEEEDWTFDCICGLYGQVDDGAHSIACERCNVWQHSKCVNIDETEADRPDFQFICTTCKRRMEEENTPRKTIKLKIKGPSEVAATKQKVSQSSGGPTDQSLSPIAPGDVVKHESQRAPTQGAEIALSPSSHAAALSSMGKQESLQAGMIAKSHEEIAPDGGKPSQLWTDKPAAVPMMRAATASKESDLRRDSEGSATMLKGDISNAAEKQPDGQTVNVGTAPLHSKTAVDISEPYTGTAQRSGTAMPQTSSHELQDNQSGASYPSGAPQQQSVSFGLQSNLKYLNPSGQTHSDLPPAPHSVDSYGDRPTVTGSAFRQLPPLQPQSAHQPGRTPSNLPSQPVAAVTPPILSFWNSSMNDPVASSEPREQISEKPGHSGDGSYQQ